MVQFFLCGMKRQMKTKVNSCPRGKIIPLWACSVVLIAALLTFPSPAAAKAKKEKGVFNVYVSVNINASADSVWKILGKQFAQIDKWSSTVISSEVVAYNNVPSGLTPSPEAPVAGRKTTSAALEAVEILVDYSDSMRRFTFKSANTPGFIVYGRNTSTVKSNKDGTSTVSFDIELKLKGVMKLFKGKFKKKLTRAMKQVQHDLKVYAETGKPAVSQSAG